MLAHVVQIQRLISHFHSFFFQIDLFFFFSLEVFKMHSKTKRHTLPIYYLVYTCVGSSIINITHQSSTFITNEEPTMRHHYHPKIIVHIRIHSWWYTVYGFWQMYNDVPSPLQYHTQEFHDCKDPLCSSSSSFSPTNLG